jgi:endonuclease YncB( thermonuclease family)
VKARCVNCARRDLSGGGSGVPEIATAILVLNPSQVYGKRAKHAVADLAFGKEVMLQTHGYDKYKRTLGDVILPDGVNLN